MPLYEYQCEKCGHRFEKIQRMSDPPPDACPVCGNAVRKMQSAPAFQFKGSGWYITDYARKDAGGKEGESTGSAKEAGDGSASGAEAASPAPKEASKDVSKGGSKEAPKSTPSSGSTPAASSKAS